MRPAENKRTEKELLEWACRILQRETRNKMFGVVEVHFQDGKVARVQTRRTELPDGE
jgi:hypothetical protein